MNRPEDDIQRTFCDWLDIQERLGKLTYYAIPNGGYRRKIEAAIMKGLGVRAGIPDIHILRGGRSLYIELKAPKKYPTQAQKEAMERLEVHGANCVVCKSFEEAKAATDAFVGQIIIDRRE